MRNHTLAGCIFFLFMAVIAPHAVAKDVILLEESVITATRTESGILDAPAHVTVITRADIERMGVRNVADLLAVQAGVAVRDYGPEGSLRSLSIRGSSSEGVLVLVDGIRMNDSRAGGVDLALIPLHSVEKIEIVRGGMSALYGADAVGGIVNIITKKDADNRLRIAVENGSYLPRGAVEVYEDPDPYDGVPAPSKSVKADAADLFDTQTATVNYSKKLGTLNLLASGSLTRANNAYTWNDGEYIDGYRRRINADMIGGDAFLGLSVPLTGGNLSVSGQLSRQKKGAPGSLSWISTDASQTDTLANGSAHFGTKRFFSDDLTLDVNASYKFQRLAYEDPDPTFPIDDVHRSHTLGVDAVQELRAFEALSLVYGVNLGFDRVASTKVGDRDRVSGGLFIETPVYAAPRLTVTPAVRLDANTDFPADFTFKLGAVYALGSRSSLKASVSKSSRAPTLNDLYWPFTAPFMGWPGEGGNPDLRPETGYAAEAGVSSVRETRTLDFFLFARYMKNEINWNLGSDNVYRPENIGESFYPGAEAVGRLRILDRMWLNTAATLVYSYVLRAASGDYSFSDDKRVPNVPVLALDAGIEYRGGRNAVSLSGRYESERYTNTTNTSSADGYFVLNAFYKRRLSETFSLSVAADNLLNADYEVIKGYPMPPLFIRTGVEAVF